MTIRVFKVLVVMLLTNSLVGVAGHDVDSDQTMAMSDLSVLTLTSSAVTTGWRNNPIPQLQCMDSVLCFSDPVQAVVCIKVGWTGKDPMWSCTPTFYLPEGVFIQHFHISCEGVDFPDDPNILVGSCGMQYTLLHVQKNGVPSVGVTTRR